MRDDDGVTLVEMVVSLFIMSIVMVLVTGAINLAYSTGETVDAATQTQSQVSVAYDRLDKVVRWADSFGTGTIGTAPNQDFYLEALSSYTGQPVCTQWRIHTTANTTTNVFQVRSWPYTVSAPAPTAWTTLATAVTAPTSPTVPFLVVPATANVVHQRVTVTVAAGSGSNSTKSSSSFVMSFTAVNTSVETAQSTSSCAAGRSIP